MNGVKVRERNKHMCLAYRKEEWRYLHYKRVVGSGIKKRDGSNYMCLVEFGTGGVNESGAMYWLG